MGLFAPRYSRVTRVAAPPGAVRRSNASLMEQRGWQHSWSGRTASGSYATRWGTWPGKIEYAGDTLRVYIRNPPSALQRHPKWHCFHERYGGWWLMHLDKSPIDRDPNACIRYVEQLLTESLKRSSS